MPKTRRLWEREFSIVEEGLDEKQVIAFVDDLIAHRDAAQKSPPDAIRSIIERAVTDAEQLAASIKIRAQKEAEDEAVKIIDKAKQGTEEIRRQAETVTQKETGDILAALNAKTRLIEEDAKQKVELLLLQARQEVEKEVREEYKEAHSRLLRSLMRVDEETLPPAEVSAPLRSEQKPGPVSKEPKAKPTAKEEAKKKAEETKKTEETRKQTEKEAEIAAREAAKKKTEEAKKAKVPASAGKGWLNQLLTMQLGKKTEVPKPEEPRQQAESGATPVALVETKKKTGKAEPPKKLPASGAKEKVSWLQQIGLSKKAEKKTKLAAPDETKKQAEEAKQTGETSQPVAQKPEPPVAESAVEKKEEKPVQVEKEVTTSKTADAITKEAPKQRPQEKKVDRQEPAGVPQKLDKEAIYEGEIELVIAVPVDPAAVSKLYNYLQSTPDMKILYTRGSWDRGTTITVALEKPAPFIGMISKISGLNLTPGLPQKENLVKGTSGSLLGAKKKEVTKIDLILKAE